MKEVGETGFWRLKANPVCRVGVFEYLGSQIDLDGTLGLEKRRKYKVYRPASELFDREAMDSFEGVPFVVGHKLLGDDADCQSVEKMPSHGTIVHVRESEDNPGVLIADIMIYTRTMKNLIESGTKGLSLGYLCDFRPEAGVHGGVSYDFVQTGLRGNHLALVKRPRNGTFVQDSADAGDILGDALVYAVNSKVGSVAYACPAFAIDSAIEETEPMKTTPKTKTPEEALSELLTGQDEEACKATLDFLKDYLEKREKAKKKPPKTPVTDGGAGAPPPPPKTDGTQPPAGNAGADGGANANAQPPAKPAEGAGSGEPPKTEPPKTEPPKTEPAKTEPPKTEPPKKEPAKPAEPPKKPVADGCGKEGDEETRKKYFREFSKANDLKTRVTPLTGAFDSAEMGEAEVAVYACRKLGIAFDEAIPDTAVYAINAALKMKAASPAPAAPVATGKTPTFDSAVSAKSVESGTQKCVAEYFGENK